MPACRTALIFGVTGQDGATVSVVSSLVMMRSVNGATNPQILLPAAGLTSAFEPFRDSK
jgi:hypothetical protein